MNKSAFPELRGTWHTTTSGLLVRTELLQGGAVQGSVTAQGTEGRLNYSPERPAVLPAVFQAAQQMGVTRIWVPLGDDPVTRLLGQRWGLMGRRGTEVLFAAAHSQRRWNGKARTINVTLRSCVRTCEPLAQWSHPNAAAALRAARELDHADCALTLLNRRIRPQSPLHSDLEFLHSLLWLQRRSEYQLRKLLSDALITLDRAELARHATAWTIYQEPRTAPWYGGHFTPQDTQRLAALSGVQWQVTPRLRSSLKQGVEREYHRRSGETHVTWLLRVFAAQACWRAAHNQKMKNSSEHHAGLPPGVQETARPTLLV